MSSSAREKQNCYTTNSPVNILVSFDILPISVIIFTKYEHLHYCHLSLFSPIFSKQQKHLIARIFRVKPMYVSHKHHPNKAVDYMTTLCTRTLSSFNLISTSSGRYSDYKPDALMHTAKTNPDHVSSAHPKTKSLTIIISLPFITLFLMNVKQL